MKKIYILFVACTLAFAISSCSKDDDSGSTTTPSGGGGTNTLDVWAAIEGDYLGDETTSVNGTTSGITVTITKISDSKIRLTPSSNTKDLKTLEIPVFKGDSSIYHQQGLFNGSFYIIANSTPPQIVLDDKDNNVTYFGNKK